MKGVIHVLCKRHEVSLRVAYKWVKALLEKPTRLVTADELEESFLLEEDPLEKYDGDPNFQHFYDPDRPDYQRSLEQMSANPQLPGSKSSPHQIQKNKNCAGYQKKENPRINRCLIPKTYMIAALTHLKSKSFANQPFPVESLTRLQRKGQPKIDLDQVLTEQMAKMSFELTQISSNALFTRKRERFFKM